MKIYNREIGPGHPVFIVAEGGSNHGGTLKAALALTDAASEAGANAIKWQLWLGASEMYDRDQFPDEWESADRWRLPLEWVPDLCARAHERDMAFGLSSFGMGSLDEADRWVDFHKVASIEAGWLPLVNSVVAKGKPTLVSNGMSGRSGWGLGDVIPLHCVVSYPADLADLHLRSYPDTPLWGFSDHTTDPFIAPCAAVALGACVVEKHIKDIHAEYSNTPDAPHALFQSDFAVMVDAIRLTELTLGTTEKHIRPSEEPYLKYRRGPRGLRGA